MNANNYKKKLYLIVIIVLIMYSPEMMNAQFISQQNGIWTDGATWGNNSPGVLGIDYPGRMDNIIIQSGHQVIVNNFNDNSSTVVSPEGLGWANVGDGQVNGIAAFPRGENPVFYHIGNITILMNGTMIMNCSSMFGGRVVLQGQLNASADLINLSAFNITSHATLTIGGNYIVTANSVTDIDGTLSIINDLYIDHTESLIGGSGSLNLTNNIETFNPSNNDVSGQICSNFTINCGNDCDPSLVGNQINIAGLSEATFCSEALPVEFQYVTAKLISQYKVEVAWITATETNNNRFEIERSIDGISWEYIGMIKGAGTSTQTNYYVFEDKKPLRGNLYYRIKQLDYNTDFTYSNQVVVSIDEIENKMLLAPNPVHINHLLQLFNTETIEQIEIFNQDGRCVKKILGTKTEIAMDFGTGVFNLRIKTNKETVNRQVMVY